MHTSPAQVPPLFTGAVYTMPLDLSYEIDVWGRVRRSFESAQNEAQASLADYATVLLSLHGDVAVNYFLLRQMDSEVALLQRTLKLRQKAFEIMSERFKAGLAPTSDVDQARTRAELTQTQVYDAQRQRADLQDALALLCGEAAPMFHIVPGAATDTVPTVPLGLPSMLLERRPDIAAAERRMAAANARIGVAYAAFFPSLSLTGEAGYSSLTTATLLTWESRLYQIGPTITLPILTGGRTESQVKQARADYNATCAAYRQTVLAGFRDVSDSLNDLHGYRQETESLKRAVTAAQATVNSTDQSYTSGLVGYLNVVDADQVELDAELQQIQASASVRVATIHLYKALGGGFQVLTSP
jgi:multidrug efflux system outer membrane protein